MKEYNPINQMDVQHLTQIVGVENIIVGHENMNKDYSGDELVEANRYPEVIVYPKSTQVISNVMKYANEKMIPVTTRGQGTGLAGGAVALFGGIMLSTERMDKILEVDEENLTATVEPGVLLMDLNNHLKQYDLMYAPDPGEKTASIGGNVSTNAGGMRAVKYGVTREHIRGIEFVLPSGEVLNFGGKIVKNSSGYSLKDLVIGSEGTLGVISTIILKLLPEPQNEISLLVPFVDLPTAIKTVPSIIKSKYTPTAIEFMQGKVILASEAFSGKKFPDNQSNAYLLLKFDGNSKTELDNAYESAAEVCLEHGAIDVLIANTNERQDTIWSARGAFLEAIKASTTEMDECDVVVPRNKIAELVMAIDEFEQEIDLRTSTFGHAGDGNVHVYLLRDNLNDQEWKEKTELMFEALFKKAFELGGDVSGEHGVGYAKLPYLEEHHGDVQMELYRNIKLAFDPNEIMNPGKVGSKRRVAVR